MLIAALMVLSTLAAVTTAYANRRILLLPADDDRCVVCSATDWHVVAPAARRCNRCGHQSGPGWLALRIGPAAAVARSNDDAPPHVPIGDECMSFESLTDLATDLVCAADDWMDGDAGNTA